VTIAVILPPNEGFAPEAVGAIGLLVHRLLAAGAEGTVIGAPTAFPPFRDVPFIPAPGGWGLRRGIRYVRGVTRVLRRLRPRLIEVHNRPEIALGLADRFRDTPILLWLNNDPQTMRRTKTLADRAVLMRRMTRVVTASEWIRGRLLEGIGGQATVLPNCIDLPVLSHEPREKLIMFAGRPVADKGVDAFVAACATVLPDLPGWRAQIIGSPRFAPHTPDTPFLAALRPAAAAAGVEMLGHMPHPDVMAAMQRAAIVAVPSRWEEPFGLTALEAMACGAALICSRRGGLPEVAGEAALYISVDEPSGFAHALRTLAQDPALCAAFGQAGRTRAAQFAAADAARALTALRAEILA